MNYGFTEDMSVVTLGKGLLKFPKLSETDAKALMEDKTTVNVSSKPIGYGKTVTVIIHSEDGVGQDICVTCHPTQRFGLRDGGECEAYQLQGKRLISIGQNHVYCTEVRPNPGDKLLYGVLKLEYSMRDYVYVNGIQVKIDGSI